MITRIHTRLALIGLLIAGLIQPLTVQATISVDTESLRLQFSEQGDLLHVESCFPACSDEDAKSRVLSSEAGMFVFEQEQSARYQLERQHKDRATVLTFTDGSGRERTRWRIPDTGWVISVVTEGAGAATLMSGEDFRPAPSSGFGYLLEQSRYLFFDGSDVEIMGLDESEPVTREVSGWFGFRNRFWTAMILPDVSL